jgi:hypothetical protein
MMSKNILNHDQVFLIAESVYFAIIEELGITSTCVEDHADGSGSTDTEKGQNLYYTIEDTIKSAINFNEMEGIEDEYSN